MRARSLGIVITTSTVLGLSSPAPADQLCIKTTGNTRLIRIRATGCKPTELSIGSFDGTTLQLSGINLQVVSGAGATDAPVNGRGNLIVGYNESSGQTRSGSHNVIVGPDHEYTRFGGLVVGSKNQIVGDYASVTGGREGIASGTCSSITGGLSNQATGDFSSVTGGGSNVASGSGAAVSGGQQHVASGITASVTGGYANSANEFGSTVNGGACNDAGGGGGPPCSPAGCVTGCFTTVNGGVRNKSSGLHATVSGGALRSATGNQDWVAGSLLEDF